MKHDFITKKIDKGNSFLKKRIQEVQDKQETFGKPDYEALEPIIKELQKGDYKAVIIAVQTKDGMEYLHKSCNSDNLWNKLIKFVNR